MNIAIVGSRRFNNYKFVEEKFLAVIDELGINLDEVTIISGGASGVDTIAQEIAKKHGLTIIIHYPNWEKYGKRAGPIRNRKIVDSADIIIAFPDKNSRGTINTIDIAKKSGKKVFVFNVS